MAFSTGHPSERPILRSKIPAEVMRGVLLNYFEQARSVLEGSLVMQEAEGAPQLETAAGGGRGWLRPSTAWTRGAIADFNRLVSRQAVAAPSL